MMLRPGCYRVMLQGSHGKAWGPIVDAEDELEAKIKAGSLFEGCEPVDAVFLHVRGKSGHQRQTTGEALDAKLAQAILLERHQGVVRLDRRRAVA